MEIAAVFLWGLGAAVSTQPWRLYFLKGFRMLPEWHALPRNACTAHVCIPATWANEALQSAPIEVPLSSKEMFSMQKGVRILRACQDVFNRTSKIAVWGLWAGV
eukprot:scaffold218486_cov19-Tisochrysis_lutea.AAC.1